jgi:hypothetical protein
MGRLVEQDDWERLVDGAVHRGDRVVQEFVEPDPVTVPMYLPAADEVIRAEVTCVFGPLVTDRRVGGIVARHMAGTTSGVVNAIGGGTTNSAFVVG